MKQLTKPIIETIRYFGGQIINIETGKELLQKWECKYCKAKFNENIKICEKCGR